MRSGVAALAGQVPARRIKVADYTPGVLRCADSYVIIPAWEARFTRAEATIYISNYRWETAELEIILVL